MGTQWKLGVRGSAWASRSYTVPRSGWRKTKPAILDRPAKLIDPLGHDIKGNIAIIAPSTF